MVFNKSAQLAGNINIYLESGLLIIIHFQKSVSSKDNGNAIHFRRFVCVCLSLYVCFNSFVQNT